MSEQYGRIPDGDRSALDARVAVFEARASAAQAKGAQAFSRLLDLAVTKNSGQAKRVAQFLASTFNGTDFAWDPFELRGLDVAIGDDMLACLDTLRWAKADLCSLVPNGESRVLAVIELWGFQWPTRD